MPSEVESILKLQDLDLEILDVRGQMKEIPAEIAGIEERKQQDRVRFEQFEEGIKQQKLRQKELEGEIEHSKAKLQKLQMQLHSIKTNQEYTAMLKEIETAGKQIAETEDRLLSVMETVENHDFEKADKKKDLDRFLEIADRQVLEKKKVLEVLEARLEDLENKRRETAALCSGELHQRYERFIKRKKTIALVPLEKNGACSGCHRNLPPNIKNEVIKGKILQCDNCARLLFWHKDPPADDAAPESPPES
jgi:hypothetical protein